MARSLILRYVPCGLAGLMVVVGSAALTRADDAEGVVRIRRDVAANAEEVVRGQSPEYGYCPESYSCPDAACRPFSNCALIEQMRLNSTCRHMRRRAQSDQFCQAVHADCGEKFDWFRCKFGYFFPSGCCGRGCPPIGHYSMVYPLDQSYVDPRDTQVYAAQGYAGPISVPLAPVVHHQYNYGWGVPSSRLTPISNPVYGQGY